MPPILSHFYLGLFVIVGLISIFTAWFCPNCLLSSRGAEIWVKIFGKKGARIFYLLIGIVMIIVALLNWN